MVVKFIFETKKQELDDNFKVSYDKKEVLIIHSSYVINISAESRRWEIPREVTRFLGQSAFLTIKLHNVVLDDDNKNFTFTYTDKYGLKQKGFRIINVMSKPRFTYDVPIRNPLRIDCENTSGNRIIKFSISGNPKPRVQVMLGGFMIYVTHLIKPHTYEVPLNEPPLYENSRANVRVDSDENIDDVVQRLMTMSFQSKM